MIYLGIFAYLMVAAIFYVIGQTTTDPKVANRSLALLAAIFWPVSILTVGSYALLNSMGMR